ncbi:DUF6303 family protein [Streptomyces sp. NBC_01233]|uniref:DUF6303 family protein n=1 Tax=Streptomyces sp. NBC_01233 TaxID=2903787 RepID=UPI002E14ADD3|nr:DUF6303 family protein [Streptomyces sp. NBC_01233]
MMPSARLANGYSGEWEVYVVTNGTPSQDWPEHDFGRSTPVPTLAERAAALAGLGYEGADGAEWEWQEFHGDATDRVRLLAALDVRPIEDSR